MRCFVAIPLPALVVSRVSLAAAGIPGARWTEPEQLHVTLAFLGDLEAGRGVGRLTSVSEVVAAVAREQTARLELRLGEPEATALVGRARTPRILWVRLVHDSALLELHDRLLRALRAAGFAMPRERFTAHVTVARLRNADPAALTRWLERHARWSVDRFEAEGIGVYTSVLRPDGARHRLVSWHPLPTKRHPAAARLTTTPSRGSDASPVVAEPLHAARLVRAMARRHRGGPRDTPRPQDTPQAMTEPQSPRSAGGDSDGRKDGTEQ